MSQTPKWIKERSKIILKDYQPLAGYPNAKRVSLMLWECQGCKDKKLDIDLVTKTGLCGTCHMV